MSPAVAGAPVTLTLDASDPDAAIGDCQPSFSYGDDLAMACTPSCAAPTGTEVPVEEPGELHTSYEHVYDSAGDDTAEATVVSGNICGSSPYGNEVDVALPFAVAP